MTDIHTSHCCSFHGCKYQDPSCTVVSGKEPQDNPCEYCLDVEVVIDNLQHTIQELVHSYKMSGSQALASHYLGQLIELAQTIEFDWRNREPDR